MGAYKSYKIGEHLSKHKMHKKHKEHKTFLVHILLSFCWF